MTASYQKWHETPVAQRIIARLSEDNTTFKRCAGIPADFDEVQHTDRTSHEAIIALNLIRDVSIDEAMGYSFYGACQSGNWNEEKAKAWLIASDAAPTVTDVVRDAFDAREPQAKAAQRSTFGMVSA